MNELMTHGRLDLANYDTPYPYEIRSFLAFCDRENLPWGQAITPYLSRFEAASTYNKHLAAIKRLVRDTVDLLNVTEAERRQLERALSRLHTRKTAPGNSEDKVPTPDEIRVLIGAADKRLSLMIEFLWETGARVGEMLDARLEKASRGAKQTRVRISGKGGHDRDLRLHTNLYDRICGEFRGKTCLFEHHGRQYSRWSVSQRIKVLSQMTIGKASTAHMIRHAVGTQVSDRYGISKAADLLGHANIRVTKDYYDHSRVTESEWEARFLENSLQP